MDALGALEDSRQSNSGTKGGRVLSLDVSSDALAKPAHKEGHLLFIGEVAGVAQEPLETSAELLNRGRLPELTEFLERITNHR